MRITMRFYLFYRTDVILVRIFSLSLRVRVRSNVSQSKLGARLCRSTESIARFYGEEATVRRTDGSRGREKFSVHE